MVWYEASNVTDLDGTGGSQQRKLNLCFSFSFPDSRLRTTPAGPSAASTWYTWSGTSTDGTRSLCFFVIVVVCYYYHYCYYYYCDYHHRYFEHFPLSVSPCLKSQSSWQSRDVCDKSVPFVSASVARSNARRWPWSAHEVGEHYYSTATEWPFWSHDHDLCALVMSMSQRSYSYMYRLLVSPPSANLPRKVLVLRLKIYSIRIIPAWIAKLSW
jgi:hypothetical protein